MFYHNSFKNCESLEPDLPGARGFRFFFPLDPEFIRQLFAPSVVSRDAHLNARQQLNHKKFAQSFSQGMIKSSLLSSLRLRSALFWRESIILSRERITSR
ncbi:hypothetical protein QS257_20635 [Terrilactibacillus sp. S3-3]|nr:hypothetical protein QS257_20635 [Terrilactibacillus sp. S3-3]